MTDMEAGRECDAEVAVRLFGFVWRNEKPPTGRFLVTPNGSPAAYAPVDSHDVTWTEYLPRYSTSIDDTWLVVEQMEKRGYWMDLHNGGAFGIGEPWHARFNRGPDEAGHGADYSPALAICRAALATVR